MADDGLQGLTETLRKLDSIGSPDGKFITKSLRTILRNSGKTLQSIILLVLKSVTGITKAAVKVRAGKRSRVGVSILVGVFTMHAKDFYAGWANFGHLAGGKRIRGSRWTEKAAANLAAIRDEITERLKTELERIAKER